MYNNTINNVTIVSTNIAIYFHKQKIYYYK